MSIPESNFILEKNTASALNAGTDIPSSELSSRAQWARGLRILVADDEEPARRSTCFMLRELGYACFDQAADGQEALAYITAHHPDIVLADIRMPGYSGIELLEKCKDMAQPPAFVFLSGYDLFAYAQKAIHLGAQGYLLKSFDCEDLQAVLDNVCESRWKIIQQKKQRESAENPNEAFAVKLLNGHLFTEQEYAWGIEHLNLSGEASSFAVIEFLADKSRYPSGQPEDLHPRYRELIRLNLQSQAGRDSFVFVFSAGAADIALLAAKEPWPAFAQRLMGLDWEGICGALQSQLGIAAAIVVGKPVPALEKITQSHHSCARVFINQLLSGDKIKNRVLFFEDPLPDCKRLSESIQNHMILLDIENLLNELEGLYNRFALVGYQSFIPVQMLHLEILRTITDSLDALGLKCESITGGMENAYTQLSVHSETEEIMIWYKLYLEQLRELLAQGAAANIQMSILRAKQFMYQNMAESISLETVSRHVGLSPNYFSSCFKRETGKTFGGYLLHIRIAQAQKLLKTGRYKAAEVGVKVGFSDNKYFYKVFKKMTGVPPGKFR